MVGGDVSLGRALRRALLILSCFALVGGTAKRAQAQSSIRVPGQRPAYSFELEPHVLLSPFEAPNNPSGDGYGLGVTVDVAKLAKYRVEDASPGGS